MPCMFPIFPSNISLELPAGYAGETLELGWRTCSNEDLVSRNSFQWPRSGWTPFVAADHADVECSIGLHVATSWAGASGGGSAHTVLFVAYRPSDVAHRGSGKVRVSRACVLGVVPVSVLGAWGLLYGANLYGANLESADLEGANLCDANLRGADLSGADLCGANLYGANLYGANLYGANLYGSYLDGANLTDANLPTP